MDVAKSRIKRDPLAEQEIEKVHTPGVKDIESLAKFLGVKEYQTMKASVFFRADNEKTVLVFIRETSR